MVCGALALTITTITHTITAKKFATFHYLVSLEKEGKVVMGVSFLFLFLSNLLYALLAWYFVFIEPMAAGSGESISICVNDLSIQCQPQVTPYTYTIYPTPTTSPSSFPSSGIPEVKVYLNGLHIPHLLSLRTLVCKALGLVCACSASLPLGKEGPMVHMGAIIAAGISQVCGVAYTIYHIPYTIHHTPYTIYHTPYTIYHIPYTIYHTPYTIH
ncbi:hypothetical protein EON63_18460, partial [archaeon]